MFSKIYGNQSIVVGIDVKKIGKDYFVYFENGQLKSLYKIKDYLKKIDTLPIGEILLNSIDRDGTGFGLDIDLIKKIGSVKKPLIFSGGLGKKEHFLEGFKTKKIDAISTSNLLNFIGSELYEVRNYLLRNKLNIPEWNRKILE